MPQHEGLLVRTFFITNFDIAMVCGIVPVCDVCLFLARPLQNNWFLVEGTKSKMGHEMGVFSTHASFGQHGKTQIQQTVETALGETFTKMQGKVSLSA